MKKLITMGILLLIVINTQAQTANLNITLSNVLSMVVSQPSNLTIDFDSETKYTNGISVTAVDHISVVSNKGFLIKVIAGVPTGPSSLAPSTVQLTSLIGTTNSGNTSGITYGSAVVLPATGGTALNIITSSNASWNGGNPTNKFNIQYLIGSGGVYANKPTGANVIPVIYSISQP